MENPMKNMQQSNRGHQKQQQQNLVSQMINHDTIIQAISIQPENQKPIINKSFDVALLGSVPLIDDIDMPYPFPRIPSNVIL
jgi:hypothetical protein